MNRRTFLAASALSLPTLSAIAKEDSPLKVGVIGHTGLGNYGHGLDTMWSKVPGTEVVAVADADAKGLAEAGTRLKISRLYRDYREMLREVKPDIVAIGPRWIDEHHDMALAAIESGARGIYIEKPFCPTLAEADEIVAACQKRSVRCAVAHRNRYQPALPAALKFIAEGGIGKVLELRGRGKEDDRGGGEDLWVLGSHVFDLARAVAGDALACSATLFTDSRPATTADLRTGAEGIGPLAGNELHARFDMEKGIPLYFDSIKKSNVPGSNFGLQVIGAEGIVDFRIDLPAFAHVMKGCPFKPTEEPRTWTTISSAGVGVPEPDKDVAARVASHELAGRDLVAAIREDRAPLCSAEDGRAIVEMICAVFESHRQNGARVSLPLQDRQHPLEKWACPEGC
jgi:predicted dehydrogenase